MASYHKGFVASDRYDIYTLRGYADYLANYPEDMTVDPMSMGEYQSQVAILAIRCLELQSFDPADSRCIFVSNVVDRIKKRLYLIK